MVGNNSSVLDDVDESDEPSRIVLGQAPKETHTVFDDIDESDEQIRVMLGQIPNRFLLWGTTVICFCLIMIVALGWYIKYPDVVPAEIVITTQNPPIAVVSRANGKINPILVADHDTVRQGQALAVVENTARHQDVYALLHALENLGALEPSALAVFSPRSSWRLGEIQESYHAFEKSSQDWKLYHSLTPQAQAIASLQKQVGEYTHLLAKQQSQQQLYKKELQLASQLFERHKQAFERQLIAPADLEQRQKEHFQAVRYRDDIKNQVSTTMIRIEELQNSILNLTIEKQRAENEYRHVLTSRLDALKTNISRWEETYVLKAPIGGKVTFFDFRSENQYVKSGDEVMTIVPGAEERPVGKVSMSLHNSGKVKDGNTVLVRLQNYPAREFGMLVGTVNNIALVPKNNAYAIEVEFRDGLKTTFNQTLEFRQEMQGSAEIITEDLRLIERIFYQLISRLNLLERT